MEADTGPKEAGMTRTGDARVFFLTALAGVVWITIILALAALVWSALSALGWAIWGIIGLFM
jgi:hypothetical protein